DLDEPNQIPLDMIDKISISEKFDKKELDLSDDGEKISENQFFVMGGEKEIKELDQGKLDLIKEHYYRYDLYWISTIATLAVMAFTLLSIAYKLARLSFEMTFNYILANIVAPVDVHDGQKTKKILTSIFNTFLVIILIFLSMKIYIICTVWLADSISGIAYIITLIAFSVAVIDGPNIVEKLFGIDAGLKSGLGMAMAGYGGAKAVGRISKGMTPKGKKSGKNKGNEKGSGDSGGSGETTPSPNDEETKQNKNNKKKKQSEKQQSQGSKSTATSPNDKESKQNEDNEKNNATNQEKSDKSTAPSPNDKEKSQGTATTKDDNVTKQGQGSKSTA